MTSCSRGEFPTPTETPHRCLFLPAQGLGFLCSLKITMDKMGLFRLSGPDRVNIALVPMDEPQKGLMLLVDDTQHFSNRTDGELGTSLALRSCLWLSTGREVPLTVPTSLTVFIPHWPSLLSQVGFTRISSVIHQLDQMTQYGHSEFREHSTLLPSKYTNRPLSLAMVGGD